MTERRKSKLEKWEVVVAGWRASGMSVAEYCRRNDIPAWKFRYAASRAALALLTTSAKAAGS